MINLRVEYYCRNCLYFEPETEKVETFGMSFVNTIVKCKDQIKCEQIHNHLMKELEELKGGGGNGKHSS